MQFSPRNEVANTSLFPLSVLYHLRKNTHYSHDWRLHSKQHQTQWLKTTSVIHFAHVSATLRSLGALAPLCSTWAAGELSSLQEDLFRAAPWTFSGWPELQECSKRSRGMLKAPEDTAEAQNLIATAFTWSRKFVASFNWSPPPHGRWACSMSKFTVTEQWQNFRTPCNLK